MSTPQPGQVYAIRTPDGATHPALCVRTEQRPGRPAPEHLFVFERGRVVWERWTADADDLDLLGDPRAAERADALAHELAHVEAQRDALVIALRRATSVVPDAVALELRRVYSDALSRLLRR